MTHPLSEELRDLPEWTLDLKVTYGFYQENAILRRRAADALDEAQHNLQRAGDFTEAWRSSALIAHKERDELRRQLEKAQTPYCLGVTTIRQLAAEGQFLASEHAFIAASDLFKKDPYERAERAEAAREKALADNRYLLDRMAKLEAVAEAAENCLSKDHVLSDLIHDAMRTVELKQALTAWRSK